MAANPKRRRILDKGTPLLDLIPMVKPLDGAPSGSVAPRRASEDDGETPPEPVVEGRFSPPVNWVSDNPEDS